ncbi:MAG: FHA domain-containing protein [Planctomycetota bacterium]
MALLLVEDAGRRWLVDLGPRAELVVGRGPTADVPLTAPRASRRHARIVRESDGGHRLEDLGSTNGTLLSGAPLAPEGARLGDGLVIGVGECRITYRTPSPETV